MIAIAYCTVLGVEAKLNTRPKLWSESDIIDIHAHIGSFRGFDISKATLKANVEHYGIKMALVSNIDCANLPMVTANLSEEEGNRQCADFVRKNQEHFRGLVWVQPTSARIDLAERFLKMRMGTPAGDKRIFVGMKFHPEFDRYFADDKGVDALLSLCAKYRVPAVFHCGQTGSLSDPARIYKAAKLHPDVDIVLYHMGFGSNHDDAINAVSNAIKNKDASLYLETSQCAAKDVLRAIKSVGARHVLFGTDATYFGKQHYQHYDDLLKTLKKDLSASDFNLIVRENALRIFPLN